MTTPNKSEKDRVIIFDTTLRDGEQCPGATMTFEEKLEVAEMLDDRDFRAQQRRMRWPPSVTRIVDVVGIDPDQPRALIAQIHGGVFGEVRMPLEILIRAPVSIPAGMDEHCPVGDIVWCEDEPRDRAVGRGRVA